MKYNFISNITCDPSIQYAKDHSKFIVSNQKEETIARKGFNPYKPSVLFVGHYKANSADPDQMPQNVASDQGLHCFLTECFIKI